ncbi:MAG: phosphoribulokinase [Thiothrix sp.]|nr:phosphoribulokinase [Thiothrix sp.]
MSAEYPIVAITGASGGSNTVITQALQHIFYRERIKAVYISGGGFHRYERRHMREAVLKARTEGRRLTHFGPEGNHLDKLESMFFQYAATGTGKYRHYLHSQALADEMGQEPGSFTRWQDMDPDNDLLLYRGLHGAMVHEDIDLAQYPDLLIGAAPSVNLEWMRRIDRDRRRGFSTEEVRQITLDRMWDFACYIAPQYTRTHINFQTVPLVDTSDPFDFDSLPTADECVLVIHFQKTAHQTDFPALVRRIPGAQMTRRDTMMVPGAQMVSAIEIILMPLINRLITDSRRLRGIQAENLARDRGAGIVGFHNQLG